MDARSLLNISPASPVAGCRVVAIKIGTRDAPSADSAVGTRTPCNGRLAQEQQRRPRIKTAIARRPFGLSAAVNRLRSQTARLMLEPSAGDILSPTGNSHDLCRSFIPSGRQLTDIQHARQDLRGLRPFVGYPCPWVILRDKSRDEGDPEQLTLSRGRSRAARLIQSSTSG